MTGGVDMKGSGVTGSRELLVIAVGVALEAGQLLASKEGRVEVAADQVQPDRRGHRDGRPGGGADQGAHPGRPPR